MLNIAINDLKSRTRRSSYFGLIAFIILILTLVCLPKGTFANVTTISIDSAKLKQMSNASWIIIAFALTYGIIFSITEFFFIKSAEEIDRQAGINNWMFSTAFSKIKYILAKFSSNCLILFSFWLVSILITAIISFLRFPLQMQLFVDRLDYFFIFLPGLFLIASLSLFFETFSWLRKTIGNIIATIGYIAILSTNLIFGLSGNNAPLLLQILDFSNTSILIRTIVKNVYKVTGSKSSEIMFLASNAHVSSAGKQSIVFSKPYLTTIDKNVLVGQLVLSIFLIVVSVLFFHNEQHVSESLQLKRPETKSQNVYTANNISARPRPNLLSTVMAEIKRLFIQINLIWGLGFIIIWLIMIINKSNIGLSLLPVLSIYSLNLYVRIIDQTQEHNFSQWLGSIKLKNLQFYGEVISLILFSLLMVLPILIKGIDLWSLILLAIMIVLIAEVSLRIFHTERLFEAIIVLYWFVYLNNANFLSNIMTYLLIDIILMSLLLVKIKIESK